MAGSSSFKDYIAARFETPLYNAVSDFIMGVDDIDQLDLRIRRLHEIGDYELSEIYVKFTSVYNLPGMRIGFDVVVEAYIEVHEGDHHYDDSELASQWFLLKCEGDLEKDLNDFVIDDVEIYERKPGHEKAMDDSLVPVMLKRNKEDMAREFLEAVYPKALLQTEAVDPMAIAAALELEVISRTITEDCSIFGQVYFRDVDTKLYNDKTGQMEPVHIKAKTILVDPRTSFLYNLGKPANSIIHEAVHFYCHRKAFELERLWNDSLSMIGCKVVGGVDGIGSSYVRNMERQANSLTCLIQMPLTPFKRLAQKRITEIRNATGLFDLIDIMEMLIEQLSVDFAVSRMAAKIRLVEVGYKEAIGTFNYVDGHYVKPYTFRSGALKENQTFTIGAADAAFERFMNLELRKLTENGDYIFVDNHFVYNTPKYVQPGEDGELELTRYALTHMDECCLIFDVKVKGQVDSYYYTECYLNSESSDITFELTFHNGYENAPPERQVAYRQRLFEEAKAVRLKMTDDPEQCMKVLLEWRGMNYTELAKEIWVNERTIRRTVNGETTPKVENGVLICFALHLPPLVSDKLLHVLRCPLDPIRNQDHQWIREALYMKYPEPISAVRKYLAPYGVTL